MPGTGFKIPPDLQVPPTQLSLSLDNSAFCSYHDANPNVYIAFRDMTRATIAKGFKHYSAKGIFELIRWHTGTAAYKDCFKVNNNYTPFYARKFEAEFPQHKDFFRKRGSKFDINE